MIEYVYEVYFLGGPVATVTLFEVTHRGERVPGARVVSSVSVPYPAGEAAPMLAIERLMLERAHVAAGGRPYSVRMGS